METNQMVAWLDEERRKDKALITKLEDRSAAQTTLIEDQNRRIQALENEIAGLRAKAVTPTLLDETIERVRNDIAASIEQMESRRASTDQEVKKMRDLDREGMNKALEGLRDEISTRIEREFGPRRAEEERLGRIATELQSYADNLSKGFEEFERSLNFLEEQRRQDSRRLSDATSEQAEIRKRVEGLTSKTELLEDLSRRNERNVGEVSKVLTDFKQERADWVEQEALAAQERERSMSDMLRRIEDFGEVMDGYAKQIELWGDTYRTMKKYVEDFDRIADRVERRLNEVAEVQRLSEDRFRQEWESFMQDDQKRWRQFTLTNDEAWRANEKLLQELQAQVVMLDEHREQLAAGVKILMNTHQEAFQAMSDVMQSAREQLADGSTASQKSSSGRAS